MAMRTFFPSSPRLVLRQAAARFRRDEDGSLIILSLQIFLIMLIVTGVAIDIVRQEERRVVIQNTLDRAMLAAADLNQALDPTAVVLDYFDKSGLGHLKVTPVVKEGEFKEWRSVEAKVTDTMPTIFGPLVGITELHSPAQSRATESIGNVEISLVLDISTSMNETVKKPDGSSTTRIAVLREAAQSFVTSMFRSVQPANAKPGKLSISVVPYNQQVVLGTNLASLYNLSTDHTSRTCVDWNVASFNGLAVSPTASLQRTMYGESFDYEGTGTGMSTTATNSMRQNCSETTAAQVLAFANDETTIKNKIKGLTANGYTAIDVGAKWGLALLDPSARPVLTQMINKNWASNHLSGRPFDYPGKNPAPEDVAAMKVLVLMTDGSNTVSYSTKPAYRTGPSGLVSTEGPEAIGSGYSTTKLWFYDPSRTSAPYYNFNYKKWYAASSVTGTKYPITYETLWGKKNFTLQYAVWTWLGVPNNNRAALYEQMAEQSEYEDKDTNLRAICAVANNQQHKIKIFTIAVDAPPEGKAVLKDCATSDAYFFPVNSADLGNAFASIASAINALRLTN